MSLAAASMAAAAFGVGDFLGGVAARGADWRQVVAVALGAGLLVLGLAASLESGFTLRFRWRGACPPVPDTLSAFRFSIAHCLRDR
jgi:hypothetical protein